MTRKEWIKQNSHTNPRDAYLHWCLRERTGETVEMETVKRDADLVAREQTFLAKLDSLNVPYRLPFKPSDSDALEALIDKKYEAATTAGAKMAVLKAGIMLIRGWMSFGQGIYDEHFGQADYEVTKRVPTYADPPYVQCGYDDPGTVIDMERDMR